MPNPKLETYKNKATGTVYDYTDAAAQAALADILDGTDIDSFSDVESALADKVDKVSDKGLSTNDYDDTEKAKVAGAFPRSEQAVLGAKNLLPITLASIKALNSSRTWNGNVTTHNGVTYTVNTDASGYVTSVEASGTATAYSFLRLCSVSSFDGSFILNGGVASGKFAYIQNETTNTGLTYSYGADSDVVNLSPTANVVNCIIAYNQGATGDATFKPMLRLATDPEPTFAPYAMTNKQLTEKLSLQNATSLLTAETGVTIGNIYKAKTGNIVTYAVVISTTAEKAANSRLLSGWDNPEPLNDGILTGHLYASGTLYKVMFTISDSQAFLQTMETIPSGASLRGTFTYITKV